MSTYSNLAIELIGTGEQDGTWGTTTNVNLGTALEEAIVGTVDQAVTASNLTLTLSNSNATQVARHLRLKLIGSSGGASNLILPSLSGGKNYYIFNASNTAVTVKTASTAGILVPAGKSMSLYQTGVTDGTDYEILEAVDYAASLAIASGVINAATIGATTPSTGAFTTLSATGAVSGAGVTARFATPGPIGNTAPSTGAFTTLAASGAVSGAGVTARFATPGPIGNTSASTGAFTTLAASGAVSGAGFNNFALLNDYSTLVNSTEKITISATNATGTINYDTGTQSVVYYTAAATGDWTINFRDSSGATLNSKMATGEVITVVHLVTLTGAEYRNTVVQVDGSSKTPEWQGGAAPTEGNINSIDSYTYTIIKTGDAAFTVLAALSQYA
jgi:hypothetical protein